MKVSTSTSIHEYVRWGSELFYTLEESIRACAAAGYEVLDMGFCSYSTQDRPLTQPDWEDWVKRNKEVADELGLEWYQGHAHFFDWTRTPASQWEFNEELVRRSIVGAGIMGVKWLVIHPGTVRDETWYSYADSFNANLEAYKRYGELAAKHNVGIAIENMIESGPERRYCSSVEELIELVDALGDPLFGVCWDTGHANMAKVDQPSALRRVGSRLKALHINDNWGTNDDHLAPYYGSIAWEPILEALKDIGYSGCFTFEIHNFLHGLPHELHGPCLRFTYELGSHMVKQITD
jgi:sugar phosphate isomerase/epimerase